jgi:hypothetical protein
MTAVQTVPEGFVTFVARFVTFVGRFVTFGA